MLVSLKFLGNLRGGFSLSSSNNDSPLEETWRRYLVYSPKGMVNNVSRLIPWARTLNPFTVEAT